MRGGENAARVLDAGDDAHDLFTADVLNATHDGIVIVDAARTILFANVAAGTMFGRAPGALIGKPLALLLPPRYRHTHEEQAGRFGAGEPSRRGHMSALVTGQHSDGRELQLDVTVSRVPAWAEGATVAVIRDATARLEQERALRASEERFRLVARASRDALYEWDAEHGTTWHGDALTRFFGHDPAVARDHDWWARTIHPDDLARVLAGRNEHARSANETWSEEYRLLRGDGSYAVILNRCIGTRDGAGVWRRSVGALMDVSELRQAEEARRQLHESQRRLGQRLRLLLDTMPVGCIVEDEAGLVTYWNPAAERIFGWSSSEMLGRSAREVLASSLIGDDMPDAFAGTRGAEGGPEVLTLATRDERSITCEWSRTPVRDANGAAAGVLGMVQDITARRSLEAQLLHAQKMEAMGRLAGGVAHDFNNLLTAILGNAALLRGSMPPDDPRAGDLEEIRQASMRAAELTQQLLAFARRQVVSPRAVELGEAVRETERLLRRLLGENIEIATSHSEAPLTVRIDPAQLGQLLINLAVNARDAMPNGGTLTVRLGEALGAEVRRHADVLSPNARYARLEVRDSGAGILPEHLPHIFEPFFTSKEWGKGTGLGLSICYGVVRQAGGEISASNAPGGGAAFVILLPLTDELPPEPLAAAELPIASAHETVLLVEDDPAVLRIFARVLRGAGYRVITAPSATDALASISSLHRTVDILVSDVVLPRMSGFELARELRRRGMAPRILFVSGHSDERVSDPSDEPLDAELLAKPVTGHELVAKVLELSRRPP